ncbi:MAG: response regulator, partial [Isosphaeraceae bacterium]
DVPIEGNLDDPTFHFGKVIAHVLGNIVTKLATAPFAALGSLRLIVQTALGLTEGLTVLTADCGEHGLRLARELQPDLLLLDVMMPGLDGPATLKQLRADPAIAHIPVIFMTAKAMPEDIKRFRAMGACGVIAKPFDPMELYGQVLSIWQAMAAERPRASEAGSRQICLPGPKCLMRSVQEGAAQTSIRRPSASR